MGLLDDAIREHLELKRRHGADPEEVSRQEREALGAPVQGEFAQPRGAAPEDVGEAAAEQPVSEVAEAAPEQPVSEVDEQLRDEPEGPADEIAPAAAPEPEPEVAPEPEPGYEEDPWLPDDDPAARTAAPEPAGEDQPAGEDVLEETPEFLQETPEHDRLWFEQKPPRDFDWDK
jgi:hypothetical protein